MVNISRIFGSLLFSIFLFTSCGNPIENDAKELAEMTCKSLQLAKEATKAAMSGDNSLVEESKELSSEVKTLSEELKAKYTTDSERKKFQIALMKELANCNQK